MKWVRYATRRDYQSDLMLTGAAGEKMRPLIMSPYPPVIRRWCETCGRHTRSQMAPWGPEEICAEHDQPDEDELLDWIDDEDDEDE